MLPLHFVPYDDLDGVPNVIVDGSPNDSTVLTLSHWPGSPTPVEVLDDLSAQIAFRALGHPHLFDGANAVSNNHFDQDGLCSAFALIDPAAALARRDRLVDIARAGDFGTFESRDAARAAFVIASLEDPQRSPLEAATFDGGYSAVAARLYVDGLQRIAELVDHVDRYSDLWAEEDAHLDESLAAIDDGTITIEDVPALDLAVVTVPEGWARRSVHRFTQQWTEAVHPMAVNQRTDLLRVLLVQGQQLQLECRYETWVMMSSRTVMPRPDLRDLAPRLDALEPGQATWTGDRPGALTPHLRVTAGGSDLAPAVVRAEIERFLADAPAAWDPLAGR